LQGREVSNRKNKDKQMPEFKSYEEMANFWDTHSLAAFWNQTEPAKFEISDQARRRNYEG
jgi:hypothetical protein